ncbi:MAG TPA: kelch repeat-containing protein [Polyangia bacterium]|nr:kelch repeat-containing protein [Polyangia bacterium]
MKHPSCRTLIILLALAGALGGCGPGGPSDGPSDGAPDGAPDGGAALVLAPSDPVLPGGAIQAFAATVTGLDDRHVTWSTTGGIITTDGVYTAPTTPGRYTVTATCVSAPTLRAAATVTVTGSGQGSNALSTGHSAHTTTSLPDGRVLIAGGVSQPFVDYARPVTAAAELFDPRTGQVTRTGDLGKARALHTATLLDDGRVLIAGGEQEGTASLDAIEVYDVTSGAFSAAGAMTTPRQGHSATLLRDGRILIAGGYDGVHQRYPNGAELYDPKTGTSTSTGQLNAARQLHTATLLADGRVLVTGGVTNYTGALSSAEIYDPQTGRFTLVPGGLRAPRFFHNAVALEGGRVLVTGGSQTLDRGTAGLGSAEYYDPAVHQFLPTGSMSLPRQLHAATVMADGRVVIVGGTSYFEGAEALDTAEVYDPRSGQFATLALRLTRVRQRHSVVATGADRIAVFGGHGSDNALAVETYPVGEALPPPAPPPPWPGGNDRYFPVGSEWARDISHAPLDAESPQAIGALAALGGWGLGVMRIDFSLNVVEADAQVPFLNFTPISDFYYPDCDNAPMPVPAGGALEGEVGYQCLGGSDCHLIVVHRASQRLYEMFRGNIIGGYGGAFYGGCLAVWDLSRRYPATGRGEQCTSSDAAGLPIAPLLFNADEVAAGSIEHAIRFILPNSRIRAGVYVHPATHAGAPRGPATAPPMGARFRLRADYPLAQLPNEAARIIARAMQRYGMILADGGTIAITAQGDRFTAHKWAGVLGTHDLEQLKVTDFEMIDAGARLPIDYNCFRNP